MKATRCRICGGWRPKKYAKSTKLTAFEMAWYNWEKCDCIGFRPNARTGIYMSKKDQKLYRKLMEE